MKKIFILSFFLIAFSFVNAQDNYFRQFDGSNQSLYVTDNTSDDLDITNNWTIEAWVKVNSYTDNSWSVIMDRRHVFSLYLINDADADFAIRFVARNDDDNIIASLQSDGSTTNLSFNQWFHVAVKYDGTTTRLYLNGIGVDDDNADPDFNLTANDSYLNIGARYWTGYSRYLDGSIDQIQISNTPKYTGNFTPPDFYTQQTSTTNTKLLLNLEQNIVDASGNFTSNEIFDHGTIQYVQKVHITPTNDQNITENTNGTPLTVAEEGTASSREWKYTTTTGSNYQSFTSAETNTTYTPNFATSGTYYVVCQSNFGSQILTSNEVKIVVSTLTNTVSIAPTDEQTIETNQNGTLLTATETPTADSREWKYSLVSGSGYQSFSTPETNTTYTPNFATAGTYYIVCVSDFGGTPETSNEVKITVNNPLSTVAITPIDNQFLLTGANGNLLTATEAPATATSREWKFTTTSGSNYQSFSTPETGTTCTPVFNEQGVYYVACISDFTGQLDTSNEVKVIVDTNTSNYYLEFDGNDYFYIKAANADFYNQVTDNYTIELWTKVNSYTDGTYPKIIDRQNCFSIYLQGDDDDDFSFVFATRDNNNSIVNSLITKNLSAINFNLDEWYHIAVTFDGTTAKFYVNGTEIANSTDDFTLNTSDNNYIYVGCRNTGSLIDYFTGDIENIHFSKSCKYSSNFTPDFYTQNIADTNSLFCLNLENEGSNHLYDFSDNFHFIYLRSSPNNPDWKNKYESSISPTADQNTVQNINGDTLTVTENGIATSREWKYSTTSGSGYVSFSSIEDSTIYVPNFATTGTYFIVCQSIINGQTVTSNEVKIVVTSTPTSVTIAPTDNQIIGINENGTQLTATESPAADSREWKFSTISESGYQAFTSPETNLTYTPNFATAGIYYVVCVSDFGGTEITSNEVKITVLSDYSILFVNDDNNLGTNNDDFEDQIIDTALSQTGYSYVKVNTTDSLPSYAFMQQFDLVFWYTGNNGITNLWNTDTTFNDSIEQYVANGGTFWLDGIDFIFDIYGSAPDDFNQGQFIYDKLGISKYVAQSHTSADGSTGLPQMDICPENKITSESPVKWQYSSLWFADGLEITDKAVPLYTMGGDAYPLAGLVTSLYTQDNTGTYLTTGLRLAKLGSGGTFVQDSVNKIFNEVIAYDNQTTSVTCENIAQTTYYLTATNGAEVKVPYSITGGFDFNSDNIFTAYLSDASGDFSSETAIGTLNYIAGDTIVATIPAGTTAGTAYRIRVKASNPALTSNDNGVDIEIVTVDVAIAPTDEQTIDVGSQGTQLTVSETPTADSREWKFSTTQGADYQSFTPTQAENSYVPQFATAGTYYVVCQSVFNGISVTSNEVVINVLDTLSIATGSISNSPFTVTDTTGANVEVPFTITGIFNSGNIFTAYLSDATGDFSNEVAIGSVTGTNDSTIQAVIPANTPSGTTYRIRIKSDNPVITGTDNGTDFEIILDTTTINIAKLQSLNIKIYPNPVSSILYFETFDNDNYNIQIIDNLGRIVYSNNLSNNQINVSNLKSGSYIVKITNNKEVNISHIIKF